MTEYERMAAVIDSSHSLLLREISEPEQNVLRLLLVEGTRSPHALSMNVGGTVIEDAYRIEFLPENRVFELIWDRYIAYAVTNESYSIADNASHSGRWLRHYSESPFMDYVRRSTCARDEYPGPANHLAVISEMHVIDVISTTLPSLHVTKLTDGSLGRDFSGGAVN